jgi:hypothetical protein
MILRGESTTFVPIITKRSLNSTPWSHGRFRDASIFPDANSEIVREIARSISRIGTFWIQWCEPRSEDRYELLEIVREISASSKQARIYIYFPHFPVSQEYFTYNNPIFRWYLHLVCVKQKQIISFPLRPRPGPSRDLRFGNGVRLRRSTVRKKN